MTGPHPFFGGDFLPGDSLTITSDQLYSLIDLLQQLDRNTAQLHSLANAPIQTPTHRREAQRAATEAIWASQAVQQIIDAKGRRRATRPPGCPIAAAIYGEEALG